MTRRLIIYLRRLVLVEPKTDTNANKSAVNEATSSALFVQGTNVWAESNLIPTTIPGSTSGVVNVRPTSAPVETTNDGTASANRTWKTD